MNRLQRLAEWHKPHSWLQSAACHSPWPLLSHYSLRMELFRLGLDWMWEGKCCLLNNCSSGTRFCSVMM